VAIKPADRSTASSVLGRAKKWTHCDFRLRGNSLTGERGRAAPRNHAGAGGKTPTRTAAPRDRVSWLNTDKKI
jgi:hypothetical protein